MNLPKGTYCLDPEKLTDLKDRWIVSMLNSAIKTATKYYQSFRFAEAGGVLYDFVWHSFCDWYVELAKPDLLGDDADRARETRTVLAYVLDKCLRALHPIIPFITEEIWQRLRSLCDNMCKGEDDYEGAVARLGRHTHLRRVRAGLQPPHRNHPRQSATSAASAACPSGRPSTSRYRRPKTSSSRPCASTSTTSPRWRAWATSKSPATFPQPKGCAVGVVGSTQIFVPLPEADIKAEIARLKEQKKKVQGFLQGRRETPRQRRLRRARQTRNRRADPRQTRRTAPTDRSPRPDNIADLGDE